MTDTEPEPTPPGDPAAKTGADAAAGTKPADDAATRLAQAVKDEIRSIDDLPPEYQEVARKFARSESSRAVNEALATKREAGDMMTKAEVQELLAQERKIQATARAEVAAMERILIREHKIAVGSEEYDKFSKASQLFQPEALRTPEGIAAVVRAAGLGEAPAPKPGAGAPTEIHAPRAFDGSALPGMPHGGVPLGELSKTADP